MSVGYGFCLLTVPQEHNELLAACSFPLSIREWGAVTGQGVLEDTLR